MAMPKFLEDYTTVDELISKMNKEYPNCKLVEEMVDKADHNSWFEMASTKANGRCLRVVFSESTTAEEMIGIAPSKEAAPKKSIEQELEKADIDYVDVSTSQIHVINNVKSFAMDLASENKTNAANWYAQALGELGINDNQLDINNMLIVKNKIQDIATEIQVGGA